jgi:hypothetical protein
VCGPSIQYHLVSLSLWRIQAIKTERSKKLKNYRGADNEYEKDRGWIKIIKEQTKGYKSRENRN